MSLKRPLLIFDGDCWFCRVWIARWRSLTRGAVDFAPYQEVGPQFKKIPPADFEKSVQLVSPNGSVLKGAEAVLATLATVRSYRWLLGLYRILPSFRWATDISYRTVAANRPFFSRLTVWLVGEDVQPSTYALSRWFFLRAVGVVFLVAILSLWSQIFGLAGENGILQTAVSDETIQVLCWVGSVAAATLILDLVPLLSIAVFWFVYLHLANICEVFMWFQWDSLILETALVAFALAPLTIRPQGFARLSRLPQPPAASLFLVKWLFFRVIFFSGYVKLASGDPSWRDLSALGFHFYTQPLPTPLSWYIQQLSPAVLQIFTVFMFLSELALPFLVFFPRRARIFCFWALFLFQVLIDTSGNYGFFGLNTAILGILLLDDAYLQRFLPEKSGFLLNTQRLAPSEPLVKRLVANGILAVVILITVFQVGSLKSWSYSLRSINDYGVFAWMTKERNEIVIEGSLDQQTWVAYEFKWKPGDPARRPPWVGVHMPRVDWQMWFAALGNYSQNPWLERFMYRLLENSPEVTTLLGQNPFASRPPRFVRALYYKYSFTNGGERTRGLGWWKREFLGQYSPVLSR
jgi:lipase maturation factor 1